MSLFFFIFKDFILCAFMFFLLLLQISFVLSRFLFNCGFYRCTNCLYFFCCDTLIFFTLLFFWNPPESVVNDGCESAISYTYWSVGFAAAVPVAGILLFTHG